MKIQNLRELYSMLLIKKYRTTEDFLSSIKNNEHYFWELSRDVAEETLLCTNNWNWLGKRIDDFAKIVEQDFIAKLDKWQSKGSLSIVCHDNSLDDTINWLFARYISMLKNLFDSRYQNSLENSYHVNIDDVEYNTTIISIAENDIYLDEFASYSDSKKIEIIEKVWNDNILDFDFNLEDLRYLCEKYQAPPAETFLKLENTTKYEVKQNENGNSQLVFTF